MKKSELFSLILLMSIIFVSGCIDVYKTDDFRIQPPVEEEWTPPILFKPVSFPSEKQFDINLSYPLELMYEYNLRWNHIPIKLYINTTNINTGKTIAEINLENLRKAMKMWEEKTNEIISFTEVSNPDEADVVIKWATRLNQTTVEARSMGMVEYTNVVDTGLFNLTTYVDVFLIASYEPFNIIAILHELGHVIGLGHSSYPDSIMYPFVDEKGNISQHDVFVVTEIYKIKPEDVQDLAIINASATKTGKYLDITTEIKNRGIIDSPDLEFEVKVDDVPVYEYTLSSISPGSVHLFSVENIFAPSKFTEIQLIIDPYKKIDEIDKENNVIILTPE